MGPKGSYVGKIAQPSAGARKKPPVGRLKFLVSYNKVTYPGPWQSDLEESDPVLYFPMDRDNVMRDYDWLT